jgi:hypothetical protein
LAKLKNSPKTPKNSKMENLAKFPIPAPAIIFYLAFSLFNISINWLYTPFSFSSPLIT